MLVRKDKAATHVGNDVGGWMAWMAEHVCVMQDNIPQDHTAHQWQGSDSGDKSTSKVHGILVYFSWSLSATEQGGLQAESIRSASCSCCWSGSSHRNKSLPPLFPFFWSREEGRLGDNHHCCCWTTARGCLTLHWSGMGSSAPAPTCPTVSMTKSQTTAHLSVGYWCDRNIRLQQLHHSDPQLIIPHIQTAATREGREQT